MKIGFQGWFLDKPYTGIGQHCIGLLDALKKEHTELLIVTPKQIKVKKWLIFEGLKKWYWERIQVPAFFANKDLDWEYYPYPSPLPKTSLHLRAMTVHDLILWKDKRYFGGKIKTFYHKEARRSLVYVDHIFTVSKTTHDLLGIPSATILKNAVPELPKKIIKNPKYNNALIYLGGYDIRKNVQGLIHAFEKAKKHLPFLNLVLIGAPHHKSKYYPTLPEAEGIINLGSISDEKVYNTLASGFAFVHYSDQEGFNIPLLQAMSVGLPAIVPNIPINREISESSALFFDLSAKDPFSAKLKMLTDPQKRKEMISMQKKVANKFTWKKTAKTFLKALRPCK
ncbi:MAG: glycosyltransferase family 1 protein [Candidatus Gracilibacteria bacterium]